ncbi:outer membrane lipoprotein [Noviherbaspirillum galbum]|uniref:Glycine zipper 2TM domain-containing protein n=1 Tax=Noviherbaspirillum galbum TaxID=2709383 RepID=A0A6B3SR26_9BURK|nr:glycine zipper 2TM domain-containing protein [Noviherbaspirillum galbum]NEX61775.1 glycine zipper 2TM domain-containing protein [Noviherbaspirillum galbum]
MEKNNSKIHPLVAGAAISVILVSLTGVAAITGLIPNSHGNNPEAMDGAPPKSTSATAASPLASSVGAATAAASPANLVDATPRANYSAMPTPIAPVQEAAPVEAAEPAPATVAKPKVHAKPKTSHATTPSYASNSAPVAPLAQAPICSSCGRIESVQAIQHAPKPSGLGVAAGAVLGGVLGNQVGNGNGRTLATIAGAVGGGYAGNEVERRTHTTTSYEVHVRMEDGSVRSFPYQSRPAWSAGDRIRIVDGQLTSRG